MRLFGGTDIFLSPWMLQFTNVYNKQIKLTGEIHLNEISSNKTLQIWTDCVPNFEAMVEKFEISNKVSFDH